MQICKAVEKAIYEIRGLAVYKTRGGGGCTHEIIVSVQKQLPNSVRAELCPEGSSQYACNIILELKCTEDKVRYALYFINLLYIIKPGSSVGSYVHQIYFCALMTCV